MPSPAGLELFTKQRPDIVITNWAMPIFNGVELTQMIRQPGLSGVDGKPVADTRRAVLKSTDRP